MRGFDLADGWGMMRNIISYVDARKKEQLKVSIGITEINGLEGLETLGIPHKYYQIDLLNKYFVCYENENITLYDCAGKFMFDCLKFDYLKEGMFLAGKNTEADPAKEKIAYALYNEAHCLTDFIFDGARMSSYFNKEGFCLVRLKDKWVDTVINKNGVILLEGANTLSNMYLRGVICVDNKNYTNLLTQQLICQCDYNGELETDELLFVKTDKNCVYQINKITGHFSVHGTMPIAEAPKKIVVAIPTAMATREPKPVMQNRNDPCACQSGKKFKHCCINKV